MHQAGKSNIPPRMRGLYHSVSRSADLIRPKGRSNGIGFKMFAASISDTLLCWGNKLSNHVTCVTVKQLKIASKNWTQLTDLGQDVSATDVSKWGVKQYAIKQMFGNIILYYSVHITRFLPYSYQVLQLFGNLGFLNQRLK